MNKQLWIQEYRAAIIPEKKEKKVIKTYGTFRSSEIDSFMKLTIKEDKLKTLIIDTLKVYKCLLSYVICMTHYSWH